MTPEHTAHDHPTVQLSGITRSYRSHHVLRGVTLDLRPGVTGLLGPNGAGKTTLLRLLATVLAPDDGRLLLLGRDEVRRVLEVVGLGDVRHRRIRKLSGGMRRRVAIAQALLGRPELLVLDEPTVGLDPEQRLRFREMLADCGPDTTVVLSTHQTGDVAALCGRVVVLHDGLVHFDGTPAELAAAAEGRVWLSDHRDPHARIAWNTAEGQVRNVGDAPPGAHLITPTIEDGYLLLVGSSAQDPSSESAA